MRPLRAPAIGLGVSYLVAVVLLGPLLGSTADSATAYAEHYADGSNVFRDLVGSMAVLVSAIMLVWTVVSAKCASAGKGQYEAVATELTAFVGLVSAAAMVVAAGLLATVPLTTAIGNLTDDPGIDDSVRAGIAQAGTVVLLVAMLTVGVTSVLIAKLGRRHDAVPNWIAVTSWIVAGTLLFGWSVALLLPFGLWAIGLGLTWRTQPTPE